MLGKRGRMTSSHTLPPCVETCLSKIGKRFYAIILVLLFELTAPTFGIISTSLL